MTQAAEQVSTKTVSTPRVRTEPNQRRVRVLFGGEAVADSSGTLYLFEEGTCRSITFPAATCGSTYVADLAENSAGR
jgi:uncharacterized protein (DUF427 family)